MNLTEKIEKVEAYFNWAVGELKGRLKLIEKLQNFSNPLIFIGDENHFHCGKLLKVRNCFTYTFERAPIPDEKNDTKMKIKIGGNVIEESYGQIEVSIPTPEVVLRNCIEGKYKEGLFVGYERKIVEIRPYDNVLTLPSIAEEISDGETEIIEKCRDVQEYLEKIDFPVYYKKFFGEKPW